MNPLKISDLTLFERERMWHGLSLLQRGQSLAAHECFEEVFRQREAEVRTLFRALSQLAAAYYQLSLGRGRGARSTWNKACRNLALVGLLSARFQQGVDALFSTLGAHEGCDRFVDKTAVAHVIEWPVPDNLRPEP